MPPQIKPRHLSIALSLLGLMAVTSLAASAAEPEDIIKYRQNIMKAIGSHSSAAGAIIQGKVDYPSDLADHVRALQALTRDLPALFPKDSDFGETKARDEVWSKRAEFEKRALDARTRADAFAAAVQGSDQKAVADRYKELGESCKACHKDFRRKED